MRQLCPALRLPRCYVVMENALEVAGEAVRSESIGEGGTWKTCQQTFRRHALSNVVTPNHVRGKFGRHGAEYRAHQDCAGRCATFGRGTVSFCVGPRARLTRDR